MWEVIATTHSTKIYKRRYLFSSQQGPERNLIVPNLHEVTTVFLTFHNWGKNANYSPRDFIWNIANEETRNPKHIIYEWFLFLSSIKLHTLSSLLWSFLFKVCLGCNQYMIITISVIIHSHYHLIRYKPFHPKNNIQISSWIRLRIILTKIVFNLTKPTPLSSFLAYVLINPWFVVPIAVSFPNYNVKIEMKRNVKHKRVRVQTLGLWVGNDFGLRKQNHATRTGHIRSFWKYKEALLTADGF